MKSMKSILAILQAFAPAAKTATATSPTVNITGYDAATVEVNAGVVTDGTFNFKIQESVDNVTFADAPAANVLGAFTQLATGAGNGSSTVQMVDYIGACPYIRIVMTVAGATTGAVLGVNVIAGSARHNPPAVTQVP